MNSISHREEFIFIYDVVDANPNGNPLDENKPRIDEETGYNLVTDVRLKRTIRDQFFNYEGHDGTAERDIFVRQTLSKKKEGGLQDGKARTLDFKGDQNIILQRCIDIRLFGGVLPMEKDSITLTGPVQFKMGRSLHRVALHHIKGTGAFASKEGAKQNTFREEYILPYSLICFYGVINENAAKHSQLTLADADAFYDAMWEGTRNLLSRSKMGHTPRLQIRIRHGQPNHFFGDLDRHIKLETEIPHEKLRDISQVRLDLSQISAMLEKSPDSQVIRTRKDERVEVVGWNP